MVDDLSPHDLSEISARQLEVWAFGRQESDADVAECSSRAARASPPRTIEFADGLTIIAFHAAAVIDGRSDTVRAVDCRLSTDG